jgi:carbamoyltransferase
LGVLYLAITQYLGFRHFGDEFKVMGLAPYGSPAFTTELRRLVHLRADGGFVLDLSYFQHWTGKATMTWLDGAPVLGQVYSPKLEALLGPSRAPDQPLTPRHEAIAASLQVVFEEAATHVLAAVAKATGLRTLCLAGGCAMNSVANGKIRERTPFESVYVQPASSDNGTALGAAAWVWHQVLGHPRSFVMDHAFWGPAFDDDRIALALADRQADLEGLGAVTEHLSTDEAVCDWAADRIAAGDVIGWFQGRMEWGARALGNRSIVADPRRADMRDIINVKIKFREKFRPFAPSVAEEALDEYFVGAVPDPFMMQVYSVRPEKRGVIPAVTHVDGSGRLQTVGRRTNPIYWELIRAFERRTGVPVLLNTSFNENEPIVHEPHEAIDCFLRTRMDAIVLGRHVVSKGPKTGLENA